METRVADPVKTINPSKDQPKEASVKIDSPSVPAREEVGLWTDDHLNMWSAYRKVSSGQIQKADFDQIIDFATTGALFFSRRIPNHATRLGKEHEASSIPQIVSIMQMLVGFQPIGKWLEKWEFTDNLNEAHYTLYVGWQVGMDMGTDACLWIFDKRKMPAPPDNFTGIRFGYRPKK